MAHSSHTVAITWKSNTSIIIVQLSNTLWHRASPDQWSHRCVAPFSVACFKHQHKRKNLSSSCNNVTVRSDHPILNCEPFEWFWFEMTETSSSKVMLMQSGPHRYTSWGKTWQERPADWLQITECIDASNISESNFKGASDLIQLSFLF